MGIFYSRQWAFSEYFGNINIFSKEWIYAYNLGWIGIQQAISDTDSEQKWFYSDNIGWINITQNGLTDSGDYYFYLSEYEDHEHISPWVLFVKNQSNNIDRVFINHGNQQSFLAYGKKIDHEIQTLGETDSIFIDQQGDQDLKDLWNSGSLLLSVDQYNSYLKMRILKPLDLIDLCFWEKTLLSSLIFIWVKQSKTVKG